MLVFLNAIQRFPEPLSAERAQLLGETYGLTTSKNVELVSSYYEVALKAGDKEALPGVVKILGSVGRMKFVRPLYRSLNKVDRDLALKTFEKNKDFYAVTVSGLIAKDLGLK